MKIFGIGTDLMIIYTHPNNAHLIEQAVKEKEPFYFGIPKIVYSTYLEQHKLVGYKPKNERFIEYDACDWTIYFGFVEPIYEPLIYIFDERRSAIMGSQGIHQCG